MGRTRYLWFGLLAVPALIAGGLYLAAGSGSVPPPSAPGTASALSTADPCGPVAAAASCTASPIHVALARVPASVRARRPTPQPAPSPSSSSPSASPGPTVSGTALPPGQQGAPAEQVLALINEARSAAGLPPLTVTVGLVASSSAHNMTMADGCGLSHQCPGEPPIGARETAAGVSWTAAGENIGEGGPVPDTTAAIARMAVALTQDMLNETPPDDGHRLNILSTAYTHIGIAVYRDPTGTVWLTQDFSN
ncbi:MAG TPA: CAP domain-containing protein [Streptosporangiaceae bacterium]